MAGILDWLSQLINGRPQAGPQQTPGATPTVGGLTGQGGPFAQPGSFMQALGIPMAILGGVEAARGKPVGAAYLEGIGGLLGDIGQQRSQFATQSNTANALEKELEHLSPQFAKDKGLQETFKGIIQNDPQAALDNFKVLQQFFEKQGKQQFEEKTIGNVPYLFDKTKGTLTKIPGSFPAAETTGKPSFEMAAWAKATHKDLNNLTPQDMQQWQQYKSDPAMARMAQANMNAIERLQISEGAAMDRQIRFEKAITDRMEKLMAEKGGPPAPTVRGYDGAFDPDVGGWVYTPSAKTTGGIGSAVMSGVAGMFGAGNRPFVRLRGDAKRYYLTETRTKKDGTTITGAILPGGRFYSAE